MIPILIGIIILASIAMILVVLVQKSKGGGLSSSFSGSNAILGYKKTTDTVEKATWVLAGIIIACSIASVSLAPRGQSAGTAVKSAVTPEQSAPDMSTPSPFAPAPVAPEGN